LRLLTIAVLLSRLCFAIEPGMYVWDGIRGQAELARSAELSAGAGLWATRVRGLEGLSSSGIRKVHGKGYHGVLDTVVPPTAEHKDATKDNVKAIAALKKFSGSIEVVYCWEAFDKGFGIFTPESQSKVKGLTRAIDLQNRPSK
jgi:hypothetical protein